MKGKELIKLNDTTKCTACRGCQVACKQWNEMPGLRTKQRGSYQNPPDLQWNTWTLIRFNEYVNENGKFIWLFRKDGCMHCTDAACVKVCPTKALYYTEYGSVGMKTELCNGCKECIAVCPFQVPKYNSAKDKVTKCDLCLNRIRDDQHPSCVKSCPTGALTIGPKEAMITKAHDRVKELGGDANVYGDKFVGGTHVLYVLGEKAEAYDALPKSPSIPLAVTVWKDILKPLSMIATGGVIAGAILHYLLHGPKRPDDHGEGKKEGGN